MTTQPRVKLSPVTIKLTSDIREHTKIAANVFLHMCWMQGVEWYLEFPFALKADAAGLFKRLQVFLQQAGLTPGAGKAGAALAAVAENADADLELLESGAATEVAAKGGARGGKGNRGGRRGGVGRGAASASGFQAHNSAILH
jgi:hypothetical protein